MTRYQTRDYVAVTREEAERLMLVDHTPPNELRVTDGVDVVHCQGVSWVLWSDGRITTGIGLSEDVQRCKSLSESVARLVSEIRGSDSGCPACGWGPILAAKDVRAVEVSRGIGHSYYAAPKLLRLELLPGAGDLRVLYALTAGYPEGYAFEVREALPSEGELTEWFGMASAEVDAWYARERTFRESLKT